MGRIASSLTLVGAVAVAASCTSNDTAAGSRTLDVTSTADACEIGASEAPAGRIVFKVTNDGSEVTEFYLLADDGQRVVGEVENIGPGLTRDLVVEASPGKYITACKPGMVGDGIRAPFTVTGSGD